MVTPGRTVGGPTLLTGICFRADRGGATTPRASGKARHYRYYTCLTAARRGKTGCEGRAIRMDRLDHLVADYPEHRLLDPNRAGHARRASRPARGTGRTPPDPGERTHQTGGGSRTAPEASLRRHRKRRRELKRSVAERADRGIEGDARPGTRGCRTREGRHRDRGPKPHAGATDKIRLRRPPPRAWKGRRISARPSAGFRAACRGRGARGPDHGLAQ